MWTRRATCERQDRQATELGFRPTAMPRVVTPVPLPQTDDQLRLAFSQLTTRADVATLLGVSEKELIYILYRKKQYTEFEISKKSGGSRTIAAPESSIKILQKRLNQVLRAVYTPKAPVHGFAVGRSILTNADRHVRKRAMLNIDLQDFFPTIHFGRVRGVFAGAPYSLPSNVAQILAQVCTYKKMLPQGAPTSPIVSNMVCTSLDSGLRRLAEEHGCTYTRYADDITFSTTRKRMPALIGSVSVDEGGKRIVQVGTAVKQVIEGNSFTINDRKVRLRVLGQRFEVTGLVVHRGVNVPREFVRNVRGLLHAWERYGEAATEAMLRARHERKHRRPGSPAVRLRDVASGKIEYIRMVRGASDLMYTKLWNRFARLAGPPFQARVALAQTPEQINSALWLLESEDCETGTAFALEGYGLVTCAHCVDKGPVIAYQPGLIVTGHAVVVTHLDAHRDLARLRLDEVPATALRCGDDGAVKTGDATIAAGYGNYAKGGSSRLTKGYVTGNGVRSGVPVIYSDHRAFAGNSGGPVLTASGLAVVGVLQRAATVEAPDQETTILPISLLDLIPEVPLQP